MSSKQPIISVKVKRKTNNKHERFGIVKAIQEVKDLVGIWYKVEADDSGSSSNHKFSELELVEKIAALRVSVGDIVHVTSTECRGIIRYIGAVKTKPGCIWYGIQLEEQKGKNNGTVDGDTYFQCFAKWGIFVKEHKIKIIPDQNKKTKKTQLEISSRFAMAKIRNVKINLFIELTNATKKIARLFLKKEKWNVDAAIDLFHEFDDKMTKKINPKSESKCNKCSRLESDDNKDKKEVVYKAPEWIKRKKQFKYQLFSN